MRFKDKMPKARVRAMSGAVTEVPMRRHLIFTVLAASMLLSSANGAEPEATAPPALEPAAPTAAASAFSPGLDDLMTMLVVPRHAKLYYAGTRRNWELAAFQARELRSSFRRISTAIPLYLDRNVAETVASLIEPKIEATEAAISAADPARFTRAYADLTAACNACHVYLEHSFLVVKAPEAAAPMAYPAQEFKPVP